MTNLPTSLGENNRKGALSPFLRRNLLVLVVSASLLGAAETIRGALVQPLVLRLGGSMTTVGIVLSLSSFSIMLPMLVFGEYTDVVGRRLPILITSLLLLVAGFLFWTATHWLYLIPAVLTAGVALSLYYPSSSAATAESVPGSRRGRAFAYKSAGQLLAGVVATFLAFLVVGRGNLQSAFLLFIIFVLVNLGLVYFLLAETLISPRPASPVSFIKNLRQNLRIPPKLKVMYIYIAILDPLAFDTGWFLMPALLTKFQGATSQQILVYIMIQGACGGLLQLSGVAGRFADWNRKWAMVLADSIAVPTILVCALAPSQQTFLAAFVMIGLAGGFFGPAIQAYVVDRVPRDRVGAELGKFWSSRGLASLFPPILGGLLAATYGYSAPLLVNVAVGVIGITVLIWKLP